MKGGGVEENDPKLKPFMDRVSYFATEFDDDAGFDKLKTKLAEPIAQLRTWDRRWAVSSVPTSLAVYWGDRLTVCLRR